MGEVGGGVGEGLEERNWRRGMRGDSGLAKNVNIN